MTAARKTTKRNDGGSRKRVAVYARISFDRSGERLGVERQIDACHELAEANGWTIVETYVDNSVSATSGVVRPEFVRMLSDGEAGRFDVLLAWDVDRIGRLLSDLLPLVKLVESGAFDIATVNSGSLDLSSAGGRLVFKILISVAEMETEHKRERQRLEWEQRKSLGRQHWPNRPFGYERDGSAHLVEGPIVVDLVRRYLNGETLASLVRDLNERGVTTSGGEVWSIQTLRQIVHNPRNAALYPDGETPGAWEALVDLDTFRSVKLLARQRRSRADSPFLLSRNVVCGRCGGTMSGGKHSSGAPRYVCHRQPENNAGGCSLSVLAEPVHAIVEAKAIELLADPDQRGRIVAAVDGADSGDVLDQIEKLNETRAEVISLVGVTITASEAKPRLDDLASEITALRATLSGTALGGTLLDAPTGSDVEPWWRETLSIEKRSLVLRDLFEPVVVMPTERRGRVFDRDRVVVKKRFD